MPKNLTQEFLKEVLSFNSDTGIFTWEKGPRAGKIAGCLCKSSGYWHLRIAGHVYQAHRIAWVYYYGKIPNFEIDHIDTNYTNNRINNLRDATRSQNMMNQRIRINSSSGFKGVGWHVRNKRWHARIGFNNKIIHIGYFSTSLEAKKAYDEKSKILFREFSRSA